MEFHPKQPTAAGRDVRCRNRGFLVAALLFIALVVSVQPAAAAISVTDVRFWSVGETTRIAIETTGDFDFKFQSLSGPPRIYFDIKNSRKRFGSGPVDTIEVNDGRVHQIRVGQNQRNVTRIVLDLAPMTTVTSSKLQNPYRLILEARGPGLDPSQITRNEDDRPAPEPEQAPPALAARVVTSPVQDDPAESERVTNPPPGEPNRSERAAVTKPSAPEPSPKPPKPQREETGEGPNIIEKPPARPSRPMAQTEPEAVADEDDSAAALPPVRPRVQLARIERNPKPKVSPASAPPKKEVAPAAPEPEPKPEPEPEEPAAEEDDSVVATPAKSNNDGGHSLTRALGLKLGRVVIDPGHGGRDTGTIGPTGLREKEVTLDVAKRLAKLIESGLGSEVVLTRDDDRKVPLTVRNDRANQERADLFVSIHVNSSRYRSVNGVETFYLNLTRSRADLEVAARENAGSDKSIHELSTLVEKIAMDDKLQESRDLAFQVQSAVHAVALRHDPKARNRGVKKAPFVVLIGAQMPSVLVELGFISNSEEERLLKTPEYRQELAEALYQGISGYAESLSHFQVASSGSDE